MKLSFKGEVEIKTEGICCQQTHLARNVESRKVREVTKSDLHKEWMNIREGTIEDLLHLSFLIDLTSNSLFKIITATLYPALVAYG